MPKAEIRFSTVPGSIPTVSELDGYKFGYNKTDAILYGIQLSGGIQSVVALTGSGSSHIRLHAINDPLDHAPVSAEYHDKILHTNATTGVIDFVSYRNDVRASGSTDSSVVTETGIRAAIDAAVSGVTSPWAVSGANIYNTNAGNVGIGTTTPSSLLDVAGTVTAYTAKLSAVGTVVAAQLLGLDADKNLTTNVLPLVLSGIQPHNAGDGLFGSAYNGSAAVTWSVDFAGTGAATSAARSDHNHDLSYAAFGHNHYLVSLADVLITSLANGQVLMYNSTLDAWENGNAGGYWKRVGTVLRPLTTGDTINVSSTGAIQAIYGISNGAVNSVGVRGSSDSGFGIYGSSDTSHGAVGISISGGGGYFNTSSGTGVIGSSASGKGGAFTSGTNFAIEAVVNNNITNQRYGLLSLVRNTTGTAADGIGLEINFQIEMSGGATQSQAVIGAELTNATSATSDFLFQLRNAGATVSEVFRLKGNGDSYLYADSYQTKENGAIHRLRGYHNYTGTPGYLKSGDYAGSLVFDAWSGASSYASVGAISVLATADHNSSNFASKMEFWLAEPSSLYPRQVAELTPEGKIKGIYGFSVFGADGITGTSTIITGVSYDSGTKTLTFTRSTLTVSGGIVTDVTAASNTVIPLS